MYKDDNKIQVGVIYCSSSLVINSFCTCYISYPLFNGALFNVLRVNVKQSRGTVTSVKISKSPHFEKNNETL